MPILSALLLLSRTTRTLILQVNKLTIKKFSLSQKMSTNFKILDNNFSVDGSVDLNHLNTIKEQSKSVLYLCPDSPDDMGAVNGFNGVKELIPSSIRTVFDPSIPTNQTDTVSKLKVSLQMFHEYEEALQQLPGPITIICKSGARASVVYAANKAYIEKKTITEILEYSQSKGLSFLTKQPLVDWLKVVVDAQQQTRQHGLLFRQLFESTSSTYSYLLADEISHEAVLIDPVLDTVDRDTKLIQELGLNLKFVLNTHVHADHITGSGQLKKNFPDCKSVISLISGAQADVKLTDYEPVIFGGRYLYGLSTPGHTKGCFSYVLDNQSMAFTGDTLLIRGCGRTDFQGGSSKELYNSVHTRIFTLPPSCALYPAHDYKGLTVTSVAEERQFNPRLTKSLEEFETIMASLNLPYPAKIDASLPRNLVCGL